MITVFSSWFGILMVRVVICDLAAAILVKVWSRRPEINQVFVNQYIVSASIGLALLFCYFRQITGAGPMLAVAVIGFFNAGALYCFWRATAISQSKTGIYAIFDDLLAMGLGWLLLGEGTFLTRLLSVGIVLAVLSTYLMARGEKLRLRKENLTSGGEKTSEESIIPWVFGFCVIWGVAIFSFRYFATVQGMHFSTFSFSWYAGALAGAFCVTKIPFKGNLAARSDQAANPQSLKQVWACSIIFGVLNIVGLVLLNIILKIAPLVAVMPATLVFASAVPVLVGLAIFQEYKQMNRLEMASIVVGLTAVVVIAFG